MRKELRKEYLQLFFFPSKERIWTLEHFGKQFVVVRRNLNLIIKQFFLIEIFVCSVLFSSSPSKFFYIYI